MHVRIADSSAKNNPANELLDSLEISYSREIPSHIGVAEVLVLLLWELPIELIEVLHVDAQVLSAIKPLYPKSICLSLLKNTRKPFNLAYLHKAAFCRLNPNSTSQLHHRVLVLRHERKLLRGQLENPVTTSALCWNRQPTFWRTSGRKLHLYACQRKPQWLIVIR